MQGQPTEPYVEERRRRGADFNDRLRASTNLKLEPNS
jgi:hypothetical protein